MNVVAGPFDIRVAIANIFDGVLAALAGAGVFGAQAWPLVLTAVVITTKRELDVYIAALKNVDELPAEARALDSQIADTPQ